MADDVTLKHPWLVAVWPGMGNVALSAGYYLMSKLDMKQIAEFEARDLFDVDHVEVKEGIIQPGRHPRSRFFGWTDPKGEHDLVVFLGEAQPPLGKHSLCHKLMEYARNLGVERVLTFAAMATDMHPTDNSRVFAAATDREGLNELRRLETEVLESGHIGGLNGVLLGVVAETGLPGACLLGEMPQVLAQLPFPRAARAILDRFTTLASIDLDLRDLDKQVARVDEQLRELLTRAEGEAGPRAMSEEPVEETTEEGVPPQTQKRIEALFKEAEKDRSKAFELKQELDRLGLFRDYEDRFLDLFKKAS
jgi:proteasome assembly chaperone (PAC2) family protein